MLEQLVQAVALLSILVCHCLIIVDYEEKHSDKIKRELFGEN